MDTKKKYSPFEYEELLIMAERLRRESLVEHEVKIQIDPKEVLDKYKDIPWGFFNK
jgi:hypothetical protein